MKLLVNIDVDDLEKGITFYQSAFGLRLGRRLFGGTVAEMVGASSYNIYLLQAIGKLGIASGLARTRLPAALDAGASRL